MDAVEPLAGLLLGCLFYLASCFILALLVCRGQRFLDLGGWLAIRGLAQKPPHSSSFYFTDEETDDNDNDNEHLKI